jgi:hypothetical protein
MSGRAPPFWPALGLGLAGAAAFIATPHAHAQRALGLSFQEASTHGRMIAKWLDGDENAPDLTAQIESRVLVVRFEQAIAVNPDALVQGLPSWASVARLDADGRTLRVGLKRSARAHVSRSIDLAAVDLVPEDQTRDPPDVVSPLAARRAAEAEKARIAALPKPPPIDAIDVRASHADGSTRLAFYWPGKTTYRVIDEKPGETTLLFSRRAEADLVYLKLEPPPHVAGVTGENTDRGYKVTVRSKDNLPIRHFMDGDAAIFDISAAKADGTSAAKAKAEPALAAVAEAPKSAGPTPAKPPQPAARLLAAEEPPLAAPPTPPGLGGGPIRLAPAAAKPAGPATDAVEVGGGTRVTQMAPSWRDPSPRSGVIDVAAKAIPNGVQLGLTFPEPAAAAVFTRGSAVWAVFGANSDLKLDPSALPPGFRSRTMRTPGATILRIETPRGVRASAQGEGGSWTIRLAPTAERPQRFVKPERVRDEAGRTRIETPLAGAAGIVWIEDPVIGDQIAAIIAYGPSSASPTPLDFVEATMPQTAHGLAVAPKSDAVWVQLKGERASVWMNQASAAEPAAESAVRRTAGNPAFIDFATWGGKSGKAWQEERLRLEKASELHDPTTVQGAAALMDLARFHVGHELAFEALGVLKVAAQQRPSLEQDAEFQGLRGAANAMAHRLEAAEASLSSGVLRNDPSAALWRGYAAAQRGDWERAADLFRQSGSEIYSYAPAWAARFAAAWAEAALSANDFDAARRKAEEAIASGGQEEADRGRLVLAMIRSVVEGPAAAYSDFQKLAETAAEPVAVRAELNRLEAGVPAGVLTAETAASELESLRYRWRGDDVEIATIGILADQYMRVGRYREAIQLAQGAAMRDPAAPGARELRIRLTDYFRRLYLDGEADRLDPIQSLGLFYEFADLTPVGADGDQMVRRLAQRLAAFDLLGPAAQLLQHQIDNRVRGASRSVLAIDLASIYLMDKRPDRALAALNSTRVPGLPKDVALERRLLEAAAYRDLGRHDHVVELMEGVDHPDARGLIADAYMRDRKWPEAARTWLAMLPAAGQAQPSHRDVALKAAIAARLSKDGGLISAARGYAPLFAGDPRQSSFDLLTAQTDVAGAALSEAVRALGDAERVDAFAASMKRRFEAEKQPAQAVTPPAAQGAAAVPAPPAPAAGQG